MIALLKVEFSRLFRNKGLYISLGIGAILSIWLVVLAVKMHNEGMALLAKEGPEAAAYFFPSSIFTIFIGIDYSQLPTAILFAIFPILVIIPFSATFSQDKESGYLRNVFTRANKKDYFFAKYITVFVSGFITVLAIFAISLYLTAMFIPAIYPESASYTFPVTGSTHLWNKIYQQNPYLYLLMYSLIDAVFLGIWATVPLSISIFIKNKFTALVGSTILYYLFNYVLMAINLDYCMPENFLKLSQPTKIVLMVILIEAITIFIITIGIFVGVGVRKNVY